MNSNNFKRLFVKQITDQETESRETMLYRESALIEVRFTHHVQTKALEGPEVYTRECLTGYHFAASEKSRLPGSTKTSWSFCPVKPYSCGTHMRGPLSEENSQWNTTMTRLPSVGTIGFLSKKSSTSSSMCKFTAPFEDIRSCWVTLEVETQWEQAPQTSSQLCRSQWGFLCRPIYFARSATNVAQLGISQI